MSERGLCMCVRGAISVSEGAMSGSEESYVRE